jgi:hypothetical protein
MFILLKALAQAEEREEETKAMRDRWQEEARAMTKVCYVLYTYTIYQEPWPR